MAEVEEPCSKSEDGNGLGVVVGVDASDVGGEGPCAPQTGTASGATEDPCA